VVDGANPTGTSGEASDTPAQAPTINITGGVLRFNDADYIKASELPGIVTQASKAGEARTLRRLQMSTTTRGKLGMI
jgi:hypothetical protein